MNMMIQIWLQKPLKLLTKYKQKRNKELDVQKIGFNDVIDEYVMKSDVRKYRKKNRSTKQMRKNYFQLREEGKVFNKR